MNFILTSLDVTCSLQLISIFNKVTEYWDWKNIKPHIMHVLTGCWILFLFISILDFLKKIFILHTNHDFPSLQVAGFYA